MKKREATLEELTKLVNRSFVGDDILIDGLGLCNRLTKYNSILSYLTSKNYIDNAISNPSVKALFVTSELYEFFGDNSKKLSFIIVENPEDEFYKLHHKLYNETNFYDRYSFDSIIGNNCNIHRTVVLEKGVIIGDNVTIGANSVLNRGVIIENNTHVGCCSVIGSEGFQILRNVKGVPYNVKHVGGTMIGENVWIGDNVTVCNSIFEGAVKIGDNCQIDSHSYIAHNCILGKDNVLTAGVTMLGSSELRDNCWIAPGALIMNRVVIANNGIVGANSMVNANVKEGVTVVGSPAISIGDFSKIRNQLNKIVSKNSDL